MGREGCLEQLQHPKIRSRKNWLSSDAGQVNGVKCGAEEECVLLQECVLRWHRNRRHTPVSLPTFLNAHSCRLFFSCGTV